MLHFKCPAENRTGLQIEIATSLSGLEQNFFCCGQVYVLRLCTQNFVILDEKLWSWQHSKAGYRYRKIAFSVKKGKLCSFFGAKFFHLGSRNFVCTLIKHIFNHFKKIIALSHPVRWQFHHSRVSLQFFKQLKALIVKFLLIASVNR